MPRIIAGKFRNFNIDQPKKEISRITIDRIKESIFNMIQFKTEGKIFIDLFAGSGSLGIEAISRGALKVLFNEKNHEAIKVIEKNLLKLKIHNYDLTKYDSLWFLDYKKGIKVDYIFADAPYDNTDLINESLIKILKNDLLKKEGYVILETNFKNENDIVIPEGFIVQKQKKYDKIVVKFLSLNL